jgi:hypothetical protein
MCGQDDKMDSAAPAGAAPKRALSFQKPASRRLLVVPRPQRRTKMRAALLTLVILAAGYAIYDDLVWRGWREEPRPRTYASLRNACEQEYGPLFGSGSSEVDRCVLRASDLLTPETEARRLKRVVESTR